MKGNNTTNEEKADEICKRHIFDSNHYDCCMEMAEWKDEQIVGILKIAAPMLYGGQKNQIKDLLGWDINWDDYKI